MNDGKSHVATEPTRAEILAQVRAFLRAFDAETADPYGGIARSIVTQSALDDLRTVADRCSR